MRVGDVFALGLAVAVTVFSFWYAYSPGSARAMLFIREESKVFVYPLDSDSDVSAKGPLGETRILVRGGGAFVTDSPCRDKLCLSMGRISKSGLWIACLPNRVFLHIEDSGEGEVDATSY